MHLHEKPVDVRLRGASSFASLIELFFYLYEFDVGGDVKVPAIFNREVEFPQIEYDVRAEAVLVSETFPLSFRLPSYRS